MLQNNVPLKVMGAGTKSYNNVKGMTHSGKSRTKYLAEYSRQLRILSPGKKKMLFRLYFT